MNAEGRLPKRLTAQRQEHKESHLTIPIMIFKPRLISSDNPLTQHELLSIKEGDLVKLCNGTDNIWSQIVDVKTRGYFDGIVSSRLNEKSYNFGDLIRFHKRHILATIV